VGVPRDFVIDILEMWCINDLNMLLTLPLAKALCGMWRIAEQRSELTELDRELREQVEDAFPSLRAIRVDDAYNIWLSKRVAQEVDVPGSRGSTTSTNPKWWLEYHRLRADAWSPMRAVFEKEHPDLKRVPEEAADQPLLPPVVLRALNDVYDSVPLPRPEVDLTELRMGMEELGYVWDEDLLVFVMTTQAPVRRRKEFTE